MALKDTLEKLRRAASEPPFDPATMIDEWQKAVDALMNKLEEFLREYENAGTLQFERDSIEIAEEALGTYQIPQMTLRAGTAVIMIRPIGRMVIGATGRVDLFRQGRGAKDERVMVLRVNGQWKVSMPPEDYLSLGLIVSPPRPPFVPLDKTSLEAALDRLLQ